MAKMKVNDFIKKAKEVERLATIYQYGGAFLQKKVNGKLITDCSGLIKGILWGYPNVKYASNGVPDINADTMISQCSSVTTDFSKIKAGWLVWMKGHIGIYIGDGKVIESTPAWDNGVQTTACLNISSIKGLHGRKWTKCGKFDKYIDYSPSSSAGNTSVSHATKISAEAKKYGLNVGSASKLGKGKRFYISLYATKYSTGVTVPARIREGETRYTSGGTKRINNIDYVLAKEIMSWVRCDECLV